ncbi:hypothetical protein SKAU_G00015410 [Synaphobranchus kaupii]|uniref:Frataxin, mitochondrial n=1 Tax=Synaphobranchus kaupii TaxID=118154 RepID=A0A9Q1GC00_SYNKA|nr:hypothetical protein SKAU_G00015410 [Synaphobranchus kaupii]
MNMSRLTAKGTFIYQFLRNLRLTQKCKAIHTSSTTGRFQSHEKHIGARRYLSTLSSRNGESTTSISSPRILEQFKLLYAGQEMKSLRRNIHDVNATRFALAEQPSQASEMPEAVFEKLVDETLDAMTDYFEGMMEQTCTTSEFDVTYSSGVLTVKVSGEHGTYVINKQTPNRQIWLSSPTSGPKRYDWTGERWIYSRDGNCLHDLLSREFSAIFNLNMDLSGLINS